MDVDELRHALGGIVLEAAMIDGRLTAATLRHRHVPQDSNSNLFS
jgi:hypothetical protein